MDAEVTQNSTLNLTIANMTNIDYGYMWYFINGIAGTTIALFGVLGNVTSAIVLLLPAMRNSTSMLLVVLAVYDTMFLIFYALLQTLSLVFSMSDVYEEYLDFKEFMISKYFHVVTYISYNGTIYMTILVTTERALVVLLPLKARLLCTNQQACIASLLVFVWSVIYCIPRYFEFAEETNFNITLPEYNEAESNFGKSYIFNVVYLVYLNSIFHVIIPVSIIIILNTAMIQRLCTRGRSTISIASTRGDSQMRLTVTIIVLTAIFCVCRLLAVLELILYPSEPSSPIGVEQFKYTCSLACNVVTVVAETSTLLNSATNFIVYSIFGRKFRRCLKDLCCFCS